MKNYQKQIAAAALALCLGACGGGAPDGETPNAAHGPHAVPAAGQNANPFEEMMHEMMDQMQVAALRYKCIDANFLASMTAHHEGAVEMARYELARGRAGAMLEMARQIIAEQDAEIKQMKDMLAHAQNCSKRASVTPAYRQAMDKSMSAMMKPFPKLSDAVSTDRAFAMAMIPHHESAQAMSRVALKYSQNKQIRKLAEGIIASQGGQIRQMRAFLQAS